MDRDLEEWRESLAVKEEAMGNGGGRRGGVNNRGERAHLGEVREWQRAAVEDWIVKV